MKNNVSAAAVAVALLCAAAPASAATNLITNGGFDVPGDIPEYQTISAGSTPVGFGWTVTGTVDVLNLDSRYGGEPDPANGDPNALDLVGVGSTGGIAQSFATVIGRSYRLTFDYANNPFIGFAEMDFGVLDGAADVFRKSLAHSGSSTSNMAWTGSEFEFTATSALSTLFFTKTQQGNLNGGMYLDNIQVEQMGAGAVPEPATWALMIGGFGFAGAALRRQRCAAAATR